MTTIVTDSYESSAINLLVKDKGDSQLLQALVAALTDQGENLIRSLLAQSRSRGDEKLTANIYTAAAICDAVRTRPTKGELISEQAYRDVPDVIALMNTKTEK